MYPFPCMFRGYCGSAPAFVWSQHVDNQMDTNLSQEGARSSKYAILWHITKESTKGCVRQLISRIVYVKLELCFMRVKYQGKDRDKFKCTYCTLVLCNKGCVLEHNVPKWVSPSSWLWQASYIANLPTLATCGHREVTHGTNTPQKLESTCGHT